MIPRDIRRQAGIQPGMTLDVRWHDGRIEIEPKTLPVELVRRGRFLVALPEAEVEQLTDEAVERTRQALADERAGQH